MEVFRSQLVISRRIAHTSKIFLAAAENRSTPAENTVSRLQQNLHSICLDAEASIGVISGFLARMGKDFSSRSSISYIL